MAGNQHTIASAGITPEMMLQAYSMGVFPMAQTADDPEILWVNPIKRGIFPLDRFHVSRSMKRFLRKDPFYITYDTAFMDVVHACADRPETWINTTLLHLYEKLHTTGYAHSLEVKQNDKLVGGIFGLSLGAAFFGESMFSTQTNASKTALTYLVARLNVGGYKLFDAQFLTPHLASLGAVEIPRELYKKRLNVALQHIGRFDKLPQDISYAQAVQFSTQTS